MVKEGVLKKKRPTELNMLQIKWFIKEVENNLMDLELSSIAHLNIYTSYHYKEDCELIKTLRVINWL